MNTAIPATVTDEALADLIERIRRTRRITSPWGHDASRGIPTNPLNDLLDY